MLTSVEDDRSLIHGRGGADTGDRIFHALVLVAAALIPLTLAGIVVLLLLDALPALMQYGFGFLASSTWDPVTEKFGAAAYVFGTVVTSLIALLLATPIGVACALFIAEYAPRRLGEPIGFLIALLAAIPSIIYGLWGFFILAPAMRSAVEPFLKNTLGNVPVIGALFSGPAVGRDLLVAGVILAIMILPTITTVSREILRAVPNTQREGMLALGATRWETIQKAVLPYARSGIAGAAILLASILWTDRPNLFSFAIFPALLVLLLAARDGRTRLLFLVPPLMLVWTDLHGGYALGLVVLMLFTIEAFVRRVAWRSFAIAGSPSKSMIRKSLPVYSTWPR